MNRFVSLVAPLGWLSSLGIHAAAAAWLLQSAHRDPLHPLPAIVTFAMVSAPRVPVPPAQIRETLMNKLPAPSDAPKLAKESVHKAASIATTPVDLTGVTLTGGEGAGWGSMTGNGRMMDTPISPAAAAATHVVTPSIAANVTHPTRAAVELVSVQDLVVKPTPPALNSRLLANYPALAKQQGQAGRAQLLVRIDADGVVRQCTVQSQSSAEFGEACRRTLLGSRWSAPQDRTGKAVVTQVYYTCDFRVSGS